MLREHSIKKLAERCKEVAEIGAKIDANSNSSCQESAKIFVAFLSMLRACLKAVFSAASWANFIGKLNICFTWATLRIPSCASSVFLGKTAQLGKTNASRFVVWSGHVGTNVRA